MKPALFLYPHISAYPVLLLLGFFFGWLLARSRRHRYGIPGKDLDNISLLLPLAGLFGARFFARLFYEKAPLLEALQFWKGDGLVFYGGFIFGVLAVLIYGLSRRMNLVALADCLAPCIPVGLAFGRVGCFLAGCCWGDACLTDIQALNVKNPEVLHRIQTIPAISTPDWPMAVTFPQKSEAARQHVKLGLLPAGSDQSLPVHPVQLYEAVLAAGLAFLLHLATRPQNAPGSISIAMLLGYALIRFCTEFLRADNKIYAGDFTFSQVVSLWIAGVCLLLLAARWIMTRRRLIPAESTPYTPHPANG